MKRLLTGASLLSVLGLPAGGDGAARRRSPPGSEKLMKPARVRERIGKFVAY